LGDLFGEAAADEPTGGFALADIKAGSRRITRRRVGVIGGSAVIMLAAVAGITVAALQPSNSTAPLAAPATGSSPQHATPFALESGGATPRARTNSTLSECPDSAALTQKLTAAVRKEFPDAAEKGAPAVGWACPNGVQYANYSFASAGKTYDLIAYLVPYQVAASDPPSWLAYKNALVSDTSAGRSVILSSYTGIDAQLTRVADALALS
jgi:hypothetical protein